MHNLEGKIKNLSPEKQELFRQLARKRNLHIADLEYHDIPILPRDGKGFPLSSSQERLWFLEQFGDLREIFNISVAYRIGDQLDISGLKAACEKTVQRHESLRTVFTDVDGVPFQHIRENSDFLFEHVELAGGGNEELDAVLRQYQKRPFDLANGPLFRVLVISLPNAEQVLSLTLHHIISDGWSMDILVKELSAVYSAITRNEEVLYEPLPIQYVDYAGWQKSRLRGVEIKKQLDFWRRELADSPQQLDLPCDYPRARQLDYSGSAVRFAVPGALVNDLKALARELNCSLYMVLLSAYALLLYRHTGSSDISVGTDVANRSELKLKPVVGFLVNQLVIRCRWGGDITLRELVKVVRGICLNAFANQDVPFNYLVEQLGVERDAGKTPLVQTKFSLDNSADAGATETSDSYIETEISATEFDVELVLKEISGELQGAFKYRTGIFAKQSIDLMVLQLERILRTIVNNPDCRLSGLELIEESQYEKLVAYNPVSTAVGSHSLIDLLLEHGTASENRIAVTGKSGQRNYKELREDVHKLAGFLESSGIGREDVLAVCLPRGIDLLVAYLAVMRIGAVYVPIDEGYGSERNSYIIRDCGARKILVSEETVGNFSASDAEPLLLADGWRETCALLKTQWPISDPEQLAYILYTSGSTGNPKGVSVRLSGLCNFLFSMRDLTGISPADNLLAVTTVAFDISGLELYLPLLVKGRLTIASEEEARDSALLWDILDQKQISYMQATPATWKGLCTVAGERKLPGLNALCGGEALSTSLAADLQQLCKSVVNLYGPTETTIWSSAQSLDKEVIRDLPNAPLGQPIANTAFYILDKNGYLQLPGVPGELCIAGEGLARNYWQKPRLTAGAFIPDTFSGKPGSRLYRTGDCVRLMSDGRLVYLGRYDDQVKVRGYRIEIGEIETALRKHDLVDQAVVVAREDSLGFSELHAFIISKHGTENYSPRDWQEKLSKHVATHLPPYMIPGTIQALREFPLTSNGKVSRRHLRDMVSSDSHKTYASKTAPRTAFENTIAQIWKEVLNAEEVFVEQNFFDFGGHSLIAVQLLNKVEKATGKRISLRAFFEEPTLSTLISLLSNENETEQVSFEAKPDPDNRFQPFPLTDLQQAYLIGRQADFDLGSIATQNYTEILMRDLDVERFTRCWNILVNRHEMLRAVYLSGARQRILPRVKPYVPAFNDFSSMSEQSREAALVEIRQQMSSQTLPEKTGPLYDIRISRLDSDNYRLHICMDLLISDVMSNMIIFNELGQLYYDEKKALPELQLSFRDYILAEEALKESSHYEKAKQYWLDRLEDFPTAPDLPLAKNPKELGQPEFRRREFHIEREAWQKLQIFAQGRGVSPSVIILAAFGQILGSWSKNDRFALNLTLFNRLPLHEEVDQIVGDFTSSLLLEINFDSRNSYLEQAKAVQERLWKDLDNKVYSGVSVIRDLTRINGGYDQVYMPVVFTSMLGMSMEGRDQYSSDRNETSNPLAEVTYSNSQTSQVWLDNQVIELNDGLTVVWDTIDGLFPEGMLDDMFDAYKNIFTDLLQEACWEKIPRVVPQKQLDIRAVLNNQSMDLEEALLHTAFERAAASDPDKVAVKQGEMSINYGQLNRWSDGLALALRQRNVKPNKLVGIVMRKGWEQVVALLAVLKSGAAYLPIDAEQPAQRIQELLSQGDCSVTLSQAGSTGALPADIHNIVVSKEILECNDTGLKERILPPAINSWSDIAYVIFTSGSTGKPKGVVIDHRGAVNTIEDINRRFEISSSDSVLALSSLNFDLSVYDIFGMLSVGGSIVIPEDNVKKEVKTWFQLVKQHGVTVWNTVPALMGLFTEYCEQVGEPAINQLRLVMMSGDWIPVDLPDRIKNLNEECKVVSLGGATEASIWSIIHEINSSCKNLNSVPYGIPLTNQSFHVLDRNLRPCPDWVIGELYIGGIGLAKGYWRDKEKTDSSFVTDSSGKRLYRTGDLGRYTQDGVIEFLGREDSQVKIQGYRVELGEIEAVLNRHDEISQSVVNVYRDEAGNKNLVAYVSYESKTCDDEPQSGVESAGILVEEQEKALFRLEQKAVRHFSENYPAVALKAIDRVGDKSNVCDESIDRISTLLSGLRQTKIEGAALPKYFYPSASSLYPVQAYVSIAREYDNVEPGFYYYSSGKNTLVKLSEYRQRPERDQQDDLRIYWIADLDAINPMYPENLVEKFLFLETGHINAIIKSQARQLSTAADYVCDRNSPANDLDRSLLPANSFFLGYTDIGANQDYDLIKPQKVMTDPTMLPAESSSGKTYRLPQENPSGSQQYDCLQRQSFRKFIGGQLAAHQLASVLSSLVANIPARLDIIIHCYQDFTNWGGQGWYRYIRDSHSIEALEAGQDGSIFREMLNGENIRIFERSGFALFIVDHNKTSQSIWMETLVAVGESCQQMMSSSWRFGVGLCPIGDLNNEVFNSKLNFDGASRVLYAFLGGAIEESQTRYWDEGESSTAGISREDGLVAYLREILPIYMVPKVIIPLRKIPLTGNGKIDRKSLPVPRMEQPHKVAREPKTPLEIKIAAIWKELLSLDVIDTSDNFFQKGGNSLVAMRIVSRLEIDHGIVVTLRNLFEYPTIAELAHFLASDVNEIKNQKPDIYRIAGRQNVENRNDVFPLTQAQRDLFVHSQVNDGQTAYNIPFALQVTGDLDVETMRRSIQYLLERHDALRTRFSFKDGEICQRIEQHQDLFFKQVNIDKTLSEEKIQAWITEFLEEESNHQFDMFNGKMMRCHLLVINESRHILMLNVHHIVADYMSVDILIRELGQIYSGMVESKPIELPHLSLQFKDYVLWREHYRQSDEGREERDYWKRLLKDLPPQELPKNPDYVRDSADGWKTYSIENRLTDAIRARYQGTGITMFTVGLVAVHQLVSALTGQRDLAIGTPISTRFNPDLEKIVGLMLNTLVLRIDSSATRSIGELLEQARSHVVSAFAHKELAPENNNLYRVRYVYRRLNTGIEEKGKVLSIETLELGKKQAKFDLLVTVNETDKEVFGEFEYRSSIFSSGTVDLMKIQFAKILEEIAFNDGGTLESLSNSLQDLNQTAQREKITTLKQQNRDRLKSVLSKKHA